VFIAALADEAIASAAKPAKIDQLNCFRWKRMQWLNGCRAALLYSYLAADHSLLTDTWKKLLELVQDAPASLVPYSFCRPRVTHDSELRKSRDDSTVFAKWQKQYILRRGDDVLWCGFFVKSQVIAFVPT
jgi:hypothetical protein